MLLLASSSRNVNGQERYSYGVRTGEEMIDKVRYDCIFPVHLLAWTKHKGELDRARASTLSNYRRA